MSMIVPLWLGVLMMLKMNSQSRQEYICKSYCLHFLNFSILVFDTFEYFQWLFPILFTVELLLIGWLYYNLTKSGFKDISLVGIQGICICSFAGVVWWITETICHSTMLYGHAIWHICMPYGVDHICQYMILIKKKKFEKNELHKFIIV